MKRMIKMPGILAVLFSANLLFAYKAEEHHKQGSTPFSLAQKVEKTAEFPAFSVTKSENDQRQYQYLTLQNGLRVLLVSDPKADKAAAALDVNVGSGNDPATRQGLAHFHEHMLFLGTEKHPQPDEYQSFISAHGGEHNAYTASENTLYFFSVNPKFLPEALGRFSQFFIAPLFNTEYVDREKNAVDSEFHAKFTSDERRFLDALRELFHSKNPHSTFGVGNLETLSDNGQSKIRDDLLAFNHKYYSANIMTLAVTGRESLADLQEMVKSNFSAIPNNAVQIPKQEQPVFKDHLLPTEVLMKSVRNERTLQLIFPLPSMQPHYRTKPDSYIAWLLGHEGEGSLFAELKKRGWAERLSAGTGLSGRFASAFQISINLTDAGYKHIDDIMELFFQSVAALKKDGITGWQYKEQQQLHDLAFRFSEKQDSAEYVSQLASAMQIYDPKDILSGEFLMEYFDIKLINDTANHIKPSNMLMVVTAPNIDTQPPSPTRSTSAKSDIQADKFLTSRFYKTPYRVEKLKPETIAQWEQAQTFAGIHMPGKNPFIAEQLKLKKAPVLAANFRSVPHKIDSGKNYRLWFLQDQEYRVPKANIMVYARSRYASSTARDAAMSELFVRLLNDHLNSTLYTARLGGLDFSIEKRSRGISFELSGYSDKQGLLLRAVLDTFKTPVFTEDRFLLIKEQWRKELINASKQSPYQQLIKDIPAVLADGHWSRESYLQALSSINQLKDVQSFMLDYTKTITADVLIYGNVYQAEALKLGQIVENSLNLTSPRQPANPARVAKLPSRSTAYLYVDRLEHSDSALIAYFQAAEDSIEQQVKTALLAQVIKSAFFQSLRTEQQLGYVVTATYLPLMRMPGLMFLVQSPGYSTGTINERINSFITDHYQFLSKQSDVWFEEQRTALLSQLQEKPQNQAERAQEYWGCMLLDYMDFDHKEQQIAALKKITREQMLDFYRANLLDKERRELLLANPGKLGLKELLNRPEQKLIEINDISALKNSLPASLLP